MQIGSCYQNLDLSNILDASQLRIYINNCGFSSSVKLDGTHANILSAQYNNGYNGAEWTISLVNSVFTRDCYIEYNSKLKSIDATDAYIYNMWARYNSNLTTLKLSLKGTSAVYMRSNPQLSIVEFYDAELSINTLSKIGGDYNNSFSTTTVDAIINSVSQSNSNNGYMVLSKMNDRSSVSQTAYNKLLSQGWNLVNNNPQ